MPPIVDASKAYVTMGEMCDALRDVWGIWRETPSFSQARNVQRFAWQRGASAAIPRSSRPARRRVRRGCAWLRSRARADALSTDDQRNGAPGVVYTASPVVEGDCQRTETSEGERTAKFGTRSPVLVRLAGGRVLPVTVGGIKGTVTLAGANTTDKACGGHGTSKVADCAQTTRSFAGARLRALSPRRECPGSRTCDERSPRAGRLSAGARGRATQPARAADQSASPSQGGAPGAEGGADHGERHGEFSARDVRLTRERGAWKAPPNGLSPSFAFRAERGLP